MQLFGEDNVLNLGQPETQESRDQWYAEAMDVEVRPVLPVMVLKAP